MSISTAKLDTLYRIASFLGEPAPGCSKQFQFAQLVRDHRLLRQLKDLPLFSFLNQREITPIDQSQGLVAELDRIRAIFRDIHVAAKNNLTAAQFNEISSQNGTRTLSRYIQLNAPHQANQDHAITVLADVLRDQIPTIPNTPVQIRGWFVNPTNQGALQGIMFLDMSFRELKCLPDEIGLLINLQMLSLIKNELSTLPETFGNLVNLEKLGLSYNKLNPLTKSIKSFLQKKGLQLGTQRIDEGVTSADRICGGGGGGAGE